MTGVGLRMALRRLRRQPLAITALWILSVLIILALTADFLASDLPLVMRYRGTLYVLPNVSRPASLRAEDNHTLKASFRTGDWAVFPLVPFGPDQTLPGGKLDVSARPSKIHLLGTDDVGRDVFAQLVHGTRLAFIIGVASVVLYVLFGVLMGALAGYFGGLADATVNGAVAVMMTFPAFLLILVIRGLMPGSSVTGVVLVIAVTGWASVARLTRGEVLRIKNETYVEAARGLGASHARILMVHVLPGAMGPVTVAATFGVAWAILIESALSFLGLGPDAASWGRLLASAQTNLGAWWLTLFPGLLIFLSVLSVNFLAEGIQNGLDPRFQPTSRRAGDPPSTLPTYDRI